MGETFIVNSLEEMCDMMCDNKVPVQKKDWYYFTFGCGQEHEGHYVKIYGTYSEARRKMLDRYGEKWGFQYSEKEWKEWAKKCPPYLLETELEVIE